MKLRREPHAEITNKAARRIRNPRFDLGIGKGLFNCLDNRQPEVVEAEIRDNRNYQ
jgi:hypothetical protein